MLVRTSKDDDQLQATRRVKAWTRKRFGFDRKVAVMAAQISCDTPGCPPIETVVAFWGEDGTRYRFKVFKPIAEVVYDDLPYAWLLPALVDDGGLGLECC
jgi:nitrate reductase delta subunit